MNITNYCWKTKLVKKPKNTLFICMLFITYSCSSVRYVPNSINIPLMQQKGQVSANLALGVTAQTAGVEISTAVGCVLHLFQP